MKANTSPGKVSISGIAVPLDEVQENPAAFVRQLERAKLNPGYAQCLCRGTAAPLRLQIRRYGSLLHLAGWPDEGPLHDRQSCSFHKDPNEAGSETGRTLPGVVTTAVGLLAKLDVALTQRTINTVSRGTRQAGAPTSSRRSTPLLGFLQALWLVAGLNRWSATDRVRNWGVCNARILAGLGDAMINGEPAEKILHVMRRFQEADRVAINSEFDAFLGRVGQRNGTNHRGLVVGEISEIGTTPYGRSITLRQSAKRYYCSNDLIDLAEKRYAHALRALGDRAARVAAILVIERTAKGHHVIVDFAAMLCSSTYVACDSIHEVAMANRLVAEGRSFDKPIRLDTGGDMLPDFVLTDTPAPTHVEVYGMNGMATYEARKREKQRLRLSRGIPAVEWNVDAIDLAEIRLPPAGR
ncbi:MULTISPECIES: DUF1173 family protein [Burkholderia cepacia complex]|uniref:DUF1173 domain-containing protein n=4 Tax=Burkholderia cepacia complex TaxID=87882 RepID=A0A0H3KRL3_BURM1|nr:MULTISPECIES: DUF1173 family protein [Burkholderia cepacia complex]ABX19255.1 conserved hypothetical protein [Burkholderia multivorans ATCC 17616]AIO71786.1 hypothetical protein DM80_5803 [Burkholderia multivorans]AOK69190.1 hypothetical protein WM33_26355 [Burkholderia multivorans]AYY99190.1 DUF1173 family protein [Burkholderia multivorans]KVV34448.1 hypothetical protein WK80_03075 [Burkholderia multivorans]